MNDKQEPAHTPIEAGVYSTQPKAAPTGSDVVNPIIRDMPSFRRMNHGRMLEQVLSERGNPIAEGVRNGTVSPEQVLQVLGLRGYPTDIDSNIFAGREAPTRSAGESELRMAATNADFDGGVLMTDANYLMMLERSIPEFNASSKANKALLKDIPLSDSEYVNRKMNYLNIDSPEFKAHEAERLGRKEEARKARIQSKMAGGMTLEEAERNDAYNAKARKELHEEAEQFDASDLFNLDTLTIEQAIEKLLAERKPGWEAQVKKIQAQQEDIKATLAKSLAKEQAARKQELLAEGYSETDAEWMKVYSKVQWHNLQVEWHLLRQQYHKGQLARLLKAGHKQVDAIRIATRIKELYTDGNPNDYPEAPELNWRNETPPPAPVLDFSTSDLEMPERFIIKDLDGFKFDPDTQFDGLRLPYDSCLFVLGQEPQRAVVLATQEDEDVITLKLLSEQKSELPWHADATLYVRLNGTRARLKWVNTRRALDKRLGMVSCVLGFLAGEQVNEIDIETVITAPEGRDIPPPKPGFSYNVVHLTQGLKGKRKDWQGGTHASPREHKRKGYWWPGRKGPIWIKATIVNKGVLGRVDKEYHVTKLIEETP